MLNTTDSPPSATTYAGMVFRAMQSEIFSRRDAGVAIEVLCKDKIDIILFGENGIEECGAFFDIKEALDFAEAAYASGLAPNLMLDNGAHVAAGKFIVTGSKPTLAFGRDGKVDFAVYLLDDQHGDDGYSIPLPGTFGSKIIIANPGAIYTIERSKCRSTGLDAIDADLTNDEVA